MAAASADSPSPEDYPTVLQSLRRVSSSRNLLLDALHGTGLDFAQPRGFPDAASSARMAASFRLSIHGRPIGFPLCVPLIGALAMPAWMFNVAETLLLGKRGHDREHDVADHLMPALSFFACSRHRSHRAQENRAEPGTASG